MTDPTLPADNAPNKAVTAAVGFLVAFVAQWVSTGHFTVDQEGITALAGAVTTLLVYVVSNRKKVRA